MNSCTTYNTCDLNKDDRLKYKSSTGTEEFNDTKGRQSENEDGQWKKKPKTTIYKKLNRKLMIEEH